MTSDFLISESPLTVLPTTAIVIGLHEAIVLQQIQYWLKIKQMDNRGVYVSSFRDGRWWVYNTIEEWQRDSFPFWSTPTIKRILSSLKAQGLVIVEQFGKDDYDRTNWYTIDYDKVNSLTVPVFEQRQAEKMSRIKRTDQNDPIDKINMISTMRRGRSARTDQVDTVDRTPVIPSLTENSSEITQRIQHPELPLSLSLPELKRKDYSGHIRTIDGMLKGPASVGLIRKRVDVDKALESPEVAACYRRNKGKFPADVLARFADVPDLEDIAKEET